jgi:hypothetical protein
MPNGHGVPLGCLVCKQYQKGESNPLFGHCQLHRIEVSMDMVCADFDNSVNDATHSAPLAEGILYAFVDVEGYGYPPPTELVPLAKILEYNAWDKQERQQARAVARDQAKIMYQRRKGLR